MPKISVTRNRVKVHVGALWKIYDVHPERFTDFRSPDVGRPGKTQRIACKYRGKWKHFGWSFHKSQVRKTKKTLIVTDLSAMVILKGMQRRKDLVGYRLILRR